eukprot:2420280-Rhodomonas_salina.1
MASRIEMGGTDDHRTPACMDAALSAPAYFPLHLQQALVSSVFVEMNREQEEGGGGARPFISLNSSGDSRLSA